MTRIGLGIVAAGVGGVILILATVYAASRLRDDPPAAECRETTSGCPLCIPAKRDAAPPAQRRNVEDFENAFPTPGGPTQTPTLAIPTELPRRNRGVVIEVPVEADLVPAEPEHGTSRGATPPTVDLGAGVSPSILPNRPLA